MPSAKYKILILSAPIGSGHALAAQALEEEFKLFPHCQIIQGSAFDFFPHFIGKTILKAYMLVLKHIPGVYELAYKWGNGTGGSLWLRNGINTFLAYLATDYLAKVQPDVVIATHATPAGIISCYKQKTGKKILLASIITDFTIHKWWLCAGTNYYFVAADNLKAQLSCLPQQEVCAYGIPIRQAFKDNFQRNTLREKYKWASTDLVCLLMGGGDGLLPMVEIIQGVTQHSHKKLHFVAITGRNKQLAAQLAALQLQIEIYGFTDDIPELMHGADFLVSKAGGLTAAETLSTTLKYIIYKPLPGQEAANAQYLKQAGAAYIAQTPLDVAKTINMYPDELQAQSMKMQTLGKPQAATMIVQKLLSAVAASKRLDQ